MVAEALDNLPKVFQDALENVEVVIEDEPTPDQSRSVDSPRKLLVLGLYQGVPLVRRGHHYGQVLPDKVSIFKKNIERICETNEDIKRVVTHTLQHELAHHFGISDQRLKDLDIY